MISLVLGLSRLVVLSAIFADKSSQCFTLDTLMQLYAKVLFVVYITNVIAASFLAFVYIKYAERSAGQWAPNLKSTQDMLNYIDSLARCSQAW